MGENKKTEVLADEKIEVLTDDDLDGVAGGVIACAGPSACPRMSVEDLTKPEGKGRVALF